jgi:hypothetical protein
MHQISSPAAAPYIARRHGRCEVIAPFVKLARTIRRVVGVADERDPAGDGICSQLGAYANVRDRDSGCGAPRLHLRPRRRL